MAVEYLTTAEGMETAWWDLWRKDPDATPFQSPAWLIPWRAHFDQGENAIVCLRQGDRLTGLVPLFQLDNRWLLWGAGASDRLNGIFDPDADRQELGDALGRLDLPIDLFQLPSQSPLLVCGLGHGWQEKRGKAESCVVMELPARLSTRMAQNLRYYRRRATSDGIGDVERRNASEIGKLIELHTRRWHERDEPGIFADVRVKAWLHEAAPALHAAGLMRLYALLRGEEVVAALCLLTAKRRAYNYIGGFDPRYARLGLGTVLVGHAIEQVSTEGFLRFDFLRGPESYKYRWGACDEDTHARHLIPPATGA